MDKDVCDFVLLGGSFSGQEHKLGGYRLFNLVKSDDMKDRKLLSLRAVDVNVRRSPGLSFINFVLGKPTVQGGVDLDSVKENVTVARDLFLEVKGNKPRIILALPDNYEDLPESFKNHKYLGSGLQLSYLERDNLMSQEQLLRDAGLHETEITDKLSQSQTKANEYMKKQMNDFMMKETQDMVKSIGKDDEQRRDRNQPPKPY
jgi:hypothetical protein